MNVQEKFERYLTFAGESPPESPDEVKETVSALLRLEMDEHEKRGEPFPFDGVEMEGGVLKVTTYEGTVYLIEIVGTLFPERGRRGGAWEDGPKMPEVKYPDCTVQLTGTDGNAMAVLGAARRALKGYLYEQEEMTSEKLLGEVHDLTAEATSGDYNHLLQTVMKWMNVE